jgi:hypothetical protein
MEWLGVVCGIQAATCTKQSRLEGNSGVGTAIGLRTRGVGGSWSLMAVVLMLSIVSTLSNAGPHRWWGGGFFGKSNLFPTGTDALPPQYWLIEGVDAV